ncbi:integral peroxisomal membrane, peroxin [Rhodotorula toruloides]|uniref:Integral peroxisomal membrane, peroxin n=1 Tax=Rhodotorula toruloides TaxID=5286 RepID=A0A511KSB5_RHOTO|nr:integral peroxisomal membrane, peroxin [Rhodotorula toruloides]
MSAPALPAARPSPPEKNSFVSLRSLGNLDDLLIGAVLKAGSPTTDYLGQLSADAVESVLRWEDPAKTVFFAACWAFLCYWPSLIILVPNVVLVSVLLATYQAKRVTGQAPESQDGPTQLAKEPPSEGSVDYLANLQNIQIMMGRVADLSDLLRSTVPFLTWRDERLTRAALHLAAVSSLLLAFAAPFVPWRLVFFVAGEATFFLGHPIVQTFLSSLAPYLSASSKDRSRLVRKLLEEDALDDDDLEMQVVEVQRIEVETRVSSGAPVEAAWQSEAVVGGELPSGFRWLGEWEDATPSDGAVDAEGWTYLHLDGTRSTTPFVQGEKGPVWAQSRRRRLTRRAIKNPLL